MTLLSAALQVLADFDDNPRVTQATINKVRRAILKHHDLMADIETYLMRHEDADARKLSRRVSDADATK